MVERGIEQALLEYKEGLGRLAKHLPEVAHAYNQFTGACFSEGALTLKEKHLIALALGVFSNDEYCIVYHTKGAVDNGASEQEVLEAAGVSAAFGGGMAMSQAVTVLLEALDELKGK
ncbi:AhpD family alkylhydroperoxidase [Laceyella sediminis]|uniref:AhpD family alkylhydroperoxidase n=1 Tax=Laceyella sediminis TaxID=573074 RepID=A0ABX5EKV2_9BACL|nr:carboxymuconolactone decarboxylase family protein [Laceyella sediminis]PRZ12418.1 AhpD family alkylhydroperoxidase [Laceyella sediminis]